MIDSASKYSRQSTRWLKMQIKSANSKYGTCEDDLVIDDDVEKQTLVTSKETDHHVQKLTKLNGTNKAKKIGFVFTALAVTLAIAKTVGTAKEDLQQKESVLGALPNASQMRERVINHRSISSGIIARNAAGSSKTVNKGFEKLRREFAAERNAEFSEREEEEKEEEGKNSIETSSLAGPASLSSQSRHEPKRSGVQSPECNTCALVLPTPEMNGKQFGEAIDSYDCVARINTHYLDAAKEENVKYREDFGTKTDFVFANVVPHTIAELTQIDHSKVDQTVKHKILTLRSINVEKTNVAGVGEREETKIPYQDQGSASPEDVYLYLDNNPGWVVTPEVIVKEATELFHGLEGAENKLWSTGFLAYTTLTRHFCASTTVFAFSNDAEADNGAKTDYYSTSLGGQRQMWQGHSFGSEHEMIRNEAANGDYGVQVQYVVDQAKLDQLAAEKAAVAKANEEANAVLEAQKKAEAENLAMISATQRATRAAIEAAQSAADKAAASLAPETVENAVELIETQQPQVVEDGEGAASIGFDDNAIAAVDPKIDPNFELVGDQSTCSESFKALFCNPALTCEAGVPCGGQGCCDRTSCNPADSCMPGVPIPGIGCCRESEDWVPEWGPSRIDHSNPKALVSVELEGGVLADIKISELDSPDYINARVLKMAKSSKKHSKATTTDGEGSEDDEIVPAAEVKEKKIIYVKKLRSPRDQKLAFELDNDDVDDDESSSNKHGKHSSKKSGSSSTAKLGMAAPTQEELAAALGKSHHRHSEDAASDETPNKSADMFDMSKVEKATAFTWKSGSAGGVVSGNNGPQGNNNMRDGKYDPPMYCDNSENCSPGQRWPGVGCCTPDSCNPDPSPSCQAGSPLPGFGCCSDRASYKFDEAEGRYKKIEYKPVTKEDLTVMMALKTLDIPGVEKPKLSYRDVAGHEGIDISAANIDAPDDKLIADFIQGKTEDVVSEDGESKQEAVDALKKEYKELIDGDDVSSSESVTDKKKPLFCNTQTENCVAGVPIPGIPCCNQPGICNPEGAETCVAGVPLPGIPCCFQQQKLKQSSVAAASSVSSKIAKEYNSLVANKQSCNPNPICTPGVPIPGVGCCKNGWGTVDGDSIEKLDASKTEKVELMHDSVEALVLKERIREELQRKDELKQKKQQSEDEENSSAKDEQKVKKMKESAKSLNQNENAKTTEEDASVVLDEPDATTEVDASVVLDESDATTEDADAEATANALEFIEEFKQKKAHKKTAIMPEPFDSDY